MMARRTRAEIRATRARGAAILASLTLTAIGARAAPEVREGVERYEIRGTTVRELKTQMKRLGPGGRRYYALTRWELTWTYTFDQGDGQCAIDSFDIVVESTTTLPSWDRATGSPDLVERWERFLAALETHERAHRRYGIRAASTIETRVAGLSPRASCEELERAIAETADETIRRFQWLESRFDEDTKHGRTEGARF